MKIHISPRILGSVATMYDDVNRIFMEFIDNSLDSAEALFNQEENKYSRPISIELRLEGNRHTNGKVIITDNCLGIEKLEDVCGNVGNSNKKKQAWTNGQFGYGIFSFIAACKNLEVTSKAKNEECFKMVLPAEVFDTDNDVQVMDKTKSMLETSSGTKIKLSGFKRERWKDISINELKSEIEDHFEGLLIRKNLEISIIENSKKFICCPFDYAKIEGPEFKETIPKLHLGKGNKKHTVELNSPIKIYLKIARNKKLERFPVFIKTGRRVEQIRNISAFKSEHKQNLWAHPKLTGYIDVGSALEPNISRKGFKNTDKSKASFNSIIEIEDEIYDHLIEANQEQSDKHYSALEDYLNKALSDLAKIDNMNFRKEFLKGNDQSLTGGGSGSETEIIEGGAKDFGNQEGNGQGGDGFGDNEGEGFKFGDTKDNSDAIGDEKGDGPKNNDDGFMDEKDFSGKPRKKAGFGIKLIQRDPDEDEKGKQVRSMVIGGDIEVFIKHPDFKARVETKRNGEEKITQRLITYLAGEITVHYKDRFYEKNKINNEYSKNQLVDLVEFIYMFEEKLKILRNKNLSDLPQD